MLIQWTMTCIKHIARVSTLRLPSSRLVLLHLRQLVVLCLAESAKIGELCITLLDLNSNNMDCGNISESDALYSQLHTHLLINTTNNLFGEGAFTRCALYQAIGQ